MLLVILSASCTPIEITNETMPTDSTIVNPEVKDTIVIGQLEIVSITVTEAQGDI